MELVVPECPAA
jgi:hypothetical protein